MTTTPQPWLRTPQARRRQRERVLRGDAHRRHYARSRPRGEEHPHAKLDERSVREIRAAAEGDGAAVRELAQMYGVSPKCIRLVLQRETWRWLE